MIASSVARSVARSVASSTAGFASGGAVEFPDLGTWQLRIAATEAYTDSGTTRATTYGQRIQQLSDLGGTNHVTQTTLANKPIFNPSCNLTGKPTIRIPANIVAKLTLPSISINSRNFSVYAIMRPLSTGEDSYGLFNFGSTSALSTPMLDFAGGVARSYLPLNSTTSQCFWGNPLVICITGGASAISTYVNNNKETLAAYTAATVSGGLILHRGDAYAFKGSDTYEYGIKEGVLTDSEVAQIVSYAQANYGVRSSWDHFLGVSGDSLAEGESDPDFLGIPHPRIVADALGPNWKCCNAAVSGLRTPAMTASAVNRLNLQVAGITGRKVFCFFGGTNDISVDSVSLATLQSRVTSFINQQTTAGFDEIYVGTITPRADASWTGSMETVRTDYNSWLRTQVGGLITNVIDLDTVTEATDPNNATYYSADKLHFLQPLREAIAAKTLSVMGF